MRIVLQNTLVLILGILPCLVFAHKLAPEIEYAMAHGAEAEICLKVCDDEGAPVSNASVRVEFDLLPDPYSVYGKTDSNGVVVVRGKTNGNKVSFFVGKDGYYGSHKEISYVARGKECNVENGKWQTKEDETKIYMRPIKNPLKMSSASVRNYKFTREIAKWIGYDLEVNDFIKPYGQGSVADFEVYLDWDKVYSLASKQMGFKIKFAEQYSGYYVVPKDGISEFGTPYSAVAKAPFMQEASFYSRKEGKRQRNTFDESKCWVVRSRCKVDENGRLVSANYSVIRYLGMSGSRDLMAGFTFCGAFNPTPNDTNLEDAEIARKSRLYYKQLLEQVDGKK